MRRKSASRRALCDPQRLLVPPVINGLSVATARDRLVPVTVRWKSRVDRQHPLLSKRCPSAIDLASLSTAKTRRHARDDPVPKKDDNKVLKATHPSAPAPSVP